MTNKLPSPVDETGAAPSVIELLTRASRDLDLAERGLSCAAEPSSIACALGAARRTLAAIPEDTPGLMDVAARFGLLVIRAEAAMAPT